MASTPAAPSDGTDPNYRETQSGLLLLRLVTEVRDDGLYVRLAPLQRSFRRVPFEEVERVAVGSYDAGTYGGWHWGVRTAPGGNTAYRVGGSDGVEVHRADGSRLFVGSDRPAELRDAVVSAGGVPAER